MWKYERRRSYLKGEKFDKGGKAVSAHRAISAARQHTRMLHTAISAPRVRLQAAHDPGTVVRAKRSACRATRSILWFRDLEQTCSDRWWSGRVQKWMSATKLCLALLGGGTLAFTPHLNSQINEHSFWHQIFLFDYLFSKVPAPIDVVIHTQVKSTLAAVKQQASRCAHIVEVFLALVWSFPVSDFAN